MAITSALGFVASLALGRLIGWSLAVVLAVVLAGLALYFFLQDRALRRGWYSPALRWVNVAVEVSAPSLFFLADSSLYSVEYALTAPLLVVWSTLVVLSGFRGSQRLSIAAGGLAALEYTLLYVFVAWPRLQPDALVTLKPGLFMVRVLLLFASGVVTALFVRHFNRRASEALSAVRMRDVMGKYLLHDRVGAGGMAEVFKATYSPEGGFEKVVALKRILPSISANQEFLRLFRFEAELCSRLNHPNVVQVLDFGRFGESFFLAMEYVDGLSLKRVLDVYQHTGLPLPAVTFLGVELCQALDYVHRRSGPDGNPLNLIHRDLNPPNVLLSMLGEVKVADFGIARATSRTELTQVGIVKGKPGYLAPEQAAGEDIDGRVDLFALGVTLHECLTGKRLFPIGDDTESLNAIFTMPIPKPSSLRKDVPEALDAAVMRLLERELPARTPNAREGVQMFMKVTGPAAAYPAGQQELAKAVKRAVVEWPELAKRARDSVMADQSTDLEAKPKGAGASKPSLPW